LEDQFRRGELRPPIGRYPSLLLESQIHQGYAFSSRLGCRSNIAQTASPEVGRHDVKLGDGAGGEWDGDVKAGEFFFESLEGQADDVAEGAGDGFDDEIAVLLNGVGAGFVERIDLFVIMVDLLEGERTEGDGGMLDEQALAVGPEVDETDAGDDLVGAALQGGKHPMGVHQIGGFAKGLAFQGDQGVHAHGDGVGKFFGHGAGLFVGVDLGELAGAEGFVREFGGVAGNDAKFEAQLLQQFRPPRRGRGQNK